ncbi:MAG: protein PilO [Desulfobacteraceae bacterium]|jgi:type IV pilus assembly protein PilO|nr:MAG: protein PilO [Desulfobacteraceae bacterium]
MKKIGLSLDAAEPLIQKIATLTKLQRILISTGTVALVIGLFVGLLYWPQFERQGQLSKQITETQANLTRVKAAASTLPEYEKKMAEKQAEFKVVAKKLPETVEVPQLLSSVSEAGKDAGLDFLLFQPEAEVPKNFYAEIPVKMELFGTYHDLGDFFDRLAQMSRIVNIKNFEAKMGATAARGRAPVKDPGRSLTIACMAETYRFLETPQEDPAAATAQKGKKKKK